MKRTILALALLASPAIAQDTYAPMPYGGAKALASMGCAGAGIAAMFRGDFSQVALPNIFGAGFRAGQYIDPERSATGSRRCAVKGAPNGPPS